MARDNSFQVLRWQMEYTAQPLLEFNLMNIQGTYGDPNLLLKLAKYRMPFGKHSTTYLIDLPLPYLNWFSKKGFPQSELGELMRIVYETKSDGMEHFLEQVRENHRRQKGAYGIKNKI